MKILILGGILLSAVLTHSETSQIDQNNPQPQNLTSQQDEGYLALSEISAEIIPVKDERFSLLDEKNIQLNVPFSHQYNDLPDDRKAEIMKSACGPAALTMLFQYSGIETELIEVIDKLPTSVYVKGVMFYNLPEGAKIYDFESVSIEPTPKAFYETLKEGHPIILNVQSYNGIIGHALVVTGIKGFDGENAEKLIIHDPYASPNREFIIVGPKQLKQPEGYINYIGTLKPFYIKRGDKSLRKLPILRTCEKWEEC